MTVCPTCGASITDTDNFCGSCGNQLSEPEPGAQDAGAGGDLFDRQPPAAGTDDADRERGPASGRTVVVPVDDEPTSTSLDEDVADPTEVVAVTGGVDLLTCPSCSAVNAAQRSRCARCGSVLDQAATDHQQEAPPPPDAPTSTSQPSRRARESDGIPTWVWVVVAGLVVGGGIGLATALGFGPLAADRGPLTDFRTTAYTDAPVTLRPSLGGSTEVMAPVGGRTFAASQLVDADLTSAWIPADADEGEVVFRFDQPVWITSVQVANGDQSSSERFEGIGRVRAMLVDLGPGSLLRARMIDGEGRQVIRPLAPVLTSEVRLDVEEVTAGDGVAMSEVEFFGHRADARDSAIWEEQR